MTVYDTLAVIAVIAVAAWAAMNLVGFLWAHAAAYKARRENRQHWRSIQPIIED